MRIDQVIQQQKYYKKYFELYTNPLISHYGKQITNDIIQKFYKQANLTEIALFYFGYYNIEPYRFVQVLVQLERENILTIPVKEGILTASFWAKWRRNNLIAVMNQRRIFGRC